MTTIELSFDEHHLPISKVGKGNGRVLPRKNVYFRVDQRSGTPYLTSEARQFRKTMRARAVELGIMRADDITPPICFGWWRLDLLVFAGRRRLDRDVLLPFIDSDGCLSPVRDAMVHCTAKQRGGPELAAVLDDDARIITDSTAVAYREGRPGLIVRLTRVRDPQAVLRERWPGVVFIDGSDD